MKKSIINIIIVLIIIAVSLVLVWIMPVKGTLFCIFFLQIITLLAIGGTNCNISNNIQNHSEHEQTEQAPYQGEEEA